MRSKLLQKFTVTLVSLLLVNSVLLAQEKKISGKVVDSNDGGALTGVTIGIKGRPNKVTTDGDGKYAIAADPAKDVLVFTYIGYVTQTIPLAGKTTFDIKLAPDSKEMSEVVVVGYGTRKRAEVTGAVASIKASEIEDIPATDIAGALRNRIAGVGVNMQSGAPGASISLNIRDARVSTNNNTTVGATTEPLYVIDGITSTQAQFDMLDPSMVDEITILKDASAAIYGASGSKGVILITTKRGKVGTPRLTYNGYVGIDDASRKTKMLSGYDQAKMINDVYDAQGFTNGNLYFNESDLQYLKDHPQKSWFDEIWQPAVLQRHNVSMSGGTEKLTFFVGGSYQNQDGNYKGDYYNRKYGFRSGLTATFSDVLKADVSFSMGYNKNYSNIDVSPTDQNYVTALLTIPQWVPIQINGLPVTYVGGPSNTTIKNPLAQNNSGFFNTKSSSSYTINTSLTYTPKAIPGLAIRFQIGQTGSWGGGNKYTAPYKQYAFKMTGSNGLFYTDTVSSVTDGIAQSAARIEPSLNKGSNYQGNITANYAKTLGKHTFSGLIGGEQSGSNADALDVYWTGQNVANVTDYWAFNLASLTLPTGGRSITESTKQSFFGRFSYDFGKRYFIDAVGRFDGSANFATGHVWGFFPNVGVAWLVSEEDFFKKSAKLSFISYLKLRANVGLTGDDRVATRLWQSRYNVDLVNSGYLFGTGSAISASLNPQQIPNPNITWQKKRTYNIGLDMSFFNSRLSFGFDYFHDYVYDEFDKNNDQNFPMYAGFAAPVLNHEEHHTYGTEFTIGYNDRLTKDLTFNTSVNFGFTTSYTSQIFQNPFQLFENSNEDWQIDLGTNQKVYNGNNIGLISKGILRSQADVDALLKQYPNYTVYATVPKVGWLYYEDQNADGKIDDHDMVPMYKNGTDPVVTLGTSLGLSYKGFQLRANIVANIGGKLMYDSQVLKAPKTNLNVAAIWNDYWTPTNPNGRFPRFDDPSIGKESTFWAVDATMIRINNMSLAYSLPMTLVKRTGFSNLRVLLTGNNLWVLKNPQPFKDPYTSHIYDYPTIRTISVGLGFGL